MEITIDGWMVAMNGENLDLDLGDFHKWICKYGEISLRIWVITENLDWMENM